MKKIKTYDEYNEGLKSSIAGLALVGTLFSNPTFSKTEANKVKDSIEYFSNLKSSKDKELNNILNEIKQHFKSSDSSAYVELYNKLTNHLEDNYGYVPKEENIEELSAFSVDALKNMSMFQILGWIGSLCLAGCGIPQAWVSYKDKHSDGISWAFLLLWAFGEVFAIIYVYDKLDMPLLVNYGVNLLIVGIMLYYKIYPKRNNIVVESNVVSDSIFKAIERELERYNIKNYTINKDLSVDVDGNVNISFRGLTKIPFKFGKVTGYFDCSDNKLSSLEGCPYFVGGDFECSRNRLRTLVGSPEEAGGSFNCVENKIVTLEGLSAEIGGNLYCESNRLSSLDTVSNIKGNIHCYENNIDPDDNGFMGHCGGKIFYIEDEESEVD